jgi:hypothetical protein
VEETPLALQLAAGSNSPPAVCFEMVSMIEASEVHFGNAQVQVF